MEHGKDVWHTVRDNANKIRIEVLPMTIIERFYRNLTKYFIFHMIPANFDFFFVCSIGWAFNCAAANLACFFFLNSTHPSLFGLIHMYTIFTETRCKSHRSSYFLDMSKACLNNHQQHIYEYFS